MIKTKINRIITGIGLSALLVMTACGTPKKDGVAATVNGVDIAEAEFVKNYASQRNYYSLSAGNEDYLKDPSADNPSKTIDEVVKESVLDDLIDMEIIRQDAEKLGIKADESYVENQINTLKEQMGGEEAFKEQLKQMGSTEEFYREYFTNYSIMQQYYQKKVEELEPTDEEIEKYYNAHKFDYFTADAAHILVADVNDANKIKKELDKGADFAEIAKEKSIDKGSGENGGELGEFSQGTMVAEFEDAIKSLKEGQISDPVKSQYGYHIIKLNKFTNKNLDEVKDEVKSAVLQEKYEAYMEKLKKDAKIEKYVNYKEEVEIPAEYKLPEGTFKTEETTDAATEQTTDESANAATDGAAEQTTNQAATEQTKTENAK